MNVIVLGSGVIGTTTAWYLAQRGARVTVIDRQPGAGLETSFANGGQISISHPEPWANPGAPAQVLRWLGRADAPLKFRPHRALAQWTWGLRFLLECLPARAHRNTVAIAALALASTTAALSCHHNPDRTLTPDEHTRFHVADRLGSAALVLDHRGNVLTRAVLDALLALHATTPHPEAPLVVYGEANRLGPETLSRARVTFRHIPYDVKAR